MSLKGQDSSKQHSRHLDMRFLLTGLRSTVQAKAEHISSTCPKLRSAFHGFFRIAVDIYVN